MPSTTSSSVSSDFASSTVITPSLPTFFIASARKRPISLSPFAEMVPTWAISSLEVTFLEFFLRSSTTASTARSTPRLRSIGFMPAATDLAPSRMIACASTVAVVVPSPAKSDDFEATSRTIWAPMFSNLSSSSISLATVTPSLVMRGAPYDLSSTTFRPFGPRVTLTALARRPTPRIILSRASTENLISLADILKNPFFVSSPAGASRVGGDKGSGSFLTGARFRRAFEHAHDVAFFHDQEFDAVEFDLRAGPFSEQHLVANLQINRDELARLIAPARADSRDLACLRFFLCCVGDNDATGGLRFGINASNDDAVVQRTKFHAVLRWGLLLLYFEGKRGLIRAISSPTFLLALLELDCQVAIAGLANPLVPH